MSTTIEIYSEHLAWWKMCCKVKAMTSPKLFAAFRDEVKRQKQHNFYLSLPMPSDFKKPLRDCKVKKCVKSIEKTGASLS